MRPIHLASLDKPRPVVVLTREAVRGLRSMVTIAPITSTIRGLAVEVVVGAANGIADGSVVNCDNVQTIRTADLGRFLGFLSDEQETALREALLTAFDL